MSQSEDQQTLKEALIAAGNLAELKLLTEDAQNLTKAEICEIINGNTKETLTVKSLNSMKAMVAARLAKGESIFPWKTMPGIKADGGGVGGGAMW